MREQWALGQLKDRIAMDRTKGFILREVEQKPISEEEAKLAWTAEEEKFLTALKDTALREKCRMDEKTPETEYVIKGVLSEEDLKTIIERDAEIIKVAEPVDPKEPLPVDPKAAAGGRK